jgi:hypothetical protein
MDGAGPQWQPEEDTTDLQPIELLQLKILVLADYSLDYGRYVLSHIAAPHVRHLTLMNLVGEDYGPLIAQITGSFTDVRLLTMYSVEFPSDPPESDVVHEVLVEWLASMPRLSYLRVANVRQVFLDAFLCNPYTVTEQASPSEQCLCPNVTTLDCQAIEPDRIISWSTRRRDRGAPLTKIYITGDIARNITQEQCQTLGAIAQLLVLGLGTNIPEEDEILK